MTASSYTNSRDDNENQLDTVETGSTITICQVAEQELTDDGTEESKEVDEKTTPLSTLRPVNKCDRSKNYVCREKIVSVC